MATLKQIADLKDQIAKLRSPRADAEYLRLLAERDRLDDKIRAAARAYEERSREQINVLVSDLNALQRERAIAENPFFQYSISLMSWYKNFISGTDFGYGALNIRWVSPNQNWVIFTSGGGTAGTGTAMGTGAYYYAAATSYLVRVVEGTDFNNGIRAKVLVDQVDGRLLKAKKEEWKAQALADDEGNPFTKNSERTEYAGFRIGDYVRDRKDDRYGYVYELSHYQREDWISILKSPQQYGNSFKSTAATERLEIVHRVEEIGYHITFEPTDIDTDR